MTFQARDIQTIIDDMKADKASRPELAGLTNSSNAAIWLNLINAFAAMTHTTEILFEDFEEGVEARALELPVGTTIWYAAESLEFQYGDSLVLVGGIPEYEVIDTTKQIVEVASATVSGGFTLIKAAKLSGGLPVKLTTAERLAFAEYWTVKRFSGASIQIISQDGDEMVVNARIEVNTQLISLTGESQSDPGTYPVEDAIREYWKTLDFNGRFTNMELQDAIQSVSGVGNVVINDVLIKAFGVAAYTNVTANLNQSAIAVAGYIIEDGTTPLNASLTYIE